MTGKNKPAKKPAAGKPSQIRDRLLMIVLILVSGVGLYLLFALSPAERPLECDGGGGSLISFGSCRER